MCQMRVNVSDMTTHEKIRKIGDVIGKQVRVRGHRRLGRREPNSTRKRPIQMEVE